MADTVSTPDAARVQPRQFSLRWLFGLMLVAAVLFALPAELWTILLLTVHVTALVSLPIIGLMVPALSVTCVQATHRLPQGVWMHLCGILGIAISALLFAAPLVGFAILSVGVLMLCAGPVLAVSECVSDGLPDECHAAAWVTVMHVTAILVALLGLAIHAVAWG